MRKNRAPLRPLPTFNIVSNETLREIANASIKRVGRNAIRPRKTPSGKIRPIPSDRKQYQQIKVGAQKRLTKIVTDQVLAHLQATAEQKREVFEVMKDIPKDFFDMEYYENKAFPKITKLIGKEKALIFHNLFFTIYNPALDKLSKHYRIYQA